MGPTPSSRRCWPTRSAWRCWWSWTPWRPPSGWRSCCTTCSTRPSARSLASWGGPRTRPGCWPAPPAAACGAPPVPDADLARQQEVAGAFLAASCDGDFDALVALLDPDMVLRADYGAIRPGTPVVVRGAAAVAGQALAFSRLTRFAQPALVKGAAGVIVAPRGLLFAVMGFTIRRGKIVEIDILADPARLRQLDFAVPGG